MTDEGLRRLTEYLVNVYRLYQGTWSGSHAEGVFDAFCIVTGRDSQEVHEWLAEAAAEADQRAHEEALDAELWVVNLGNPDDDDYGDYEVLVDPEDLFPLDLKAENVHRLIELAERLIEMDEPGSEARRTVTLNAIIQRARAALGVEEK